MALSNLSSMLAVAWLAAGAADVPGPAGDARGVVEQAMAAMGGRARLEALHSLSLDLRTVGYRMDDSEREPGPDWLNVAVGREWRDEDGARLRQEIDEASAQWTIRHVKLEGGGALADQRLWRGTWSWSAQHSTGERLALSPERILFTALAAPNLRRAPDAVLNGVGQQAVDFTWNGVPVRLYMDAVMHLPSRMELTRGSRTDMANAILGDAAWRTDFLFYRRQTDGLVYPFQWNLFRDGRPAVTTVVTAMEENPAPPPGGYDPPPEARAAIARIVDFADNQTIAGPDAEALRPLADHVWMIQGNWNLMVVRQPDGLVVVECPQSSAYSENVLALLGRRFPGVRVKAVVSTTDSLWHIAGARPYATRGVPIYALDLNAGRLKAFLARPHALIPDALQLHPGKARIIPVADRTVIGDGPTRIELHPIRGHGDERMMMAFLPASGLLYGSSNDLSPAPRRATFNMFELVERVQALGLPVTTYVAIHTPATSWPEAVEIAMHQPNLLND